jgi:hypothetical protein
MFNIQAVAPNPQDESRSYLGRSQSPVKLDSATCVPASSNTNQVAGWVESRLNCSTPIPPTSSTINEAMAGKNGGVGISGRPQAPL